MNIFNSIKLTIALLVIVTGFAGCAQDEAKEFIYAGTFTGEGGEGIFVFEFDRENLEMVHIQTLSDRESPSFQAIHPEKHTLYSASRSPFDGDGDQHTIGSYRIDGNTGMLTLINEQSVLGRGPAHVSVDPMGKLVYVSNYSTGNFSVFPVREDGGLDEASDFIQHEGSSIHPSRQQAPHAHAADPSPDGKFIYVSDLGLDQIKIYKVDRQSGKITSADTPWFASTPGSGPRHFTFHPDGEFAYSAEELSSTIAALRVDKNTGALEQIQHVPMLPDDFVGSSTAADIHVSPDGKFLYATNRGHDSLVIYAIDESTGELELVGHQSTMGAHPRNFMIDHTGDYIFVANRDNDHIVLFERNKSTGELTFTGLEVTVTRAVCITQLVL